MLVTKSVNITEHTILLKWQHSEEISSSRKHHFICWWELCQSTAEGMNFPDIKNVIFTTLHLHISLLKILGQSNNLQLISCAKTTPLVLRVFLQSHLSARRKTQRKFLASGELETPRASLGWWQHPKPWELWGAAGANSGGRFGQKTPSPCIPIPLTWTGPRWWNSPPGAQFHSQFPVYTQLISVGTRQPKLLRGCFNFSLI